jgi:hypothetical protein
MVGEPNSAGMLPLSVATRRGGVWSSTSAEGTVDIALSDGVSEVRSVAGNNELGGLDYDEAILGVVRARLVAMHPGWCCQTRRRSTCAGKPNGRSDCSAPGTKRSS